MLTFIKKDMLIMIRDRQELKILLLMPFVLTLILGFALRGVMSGEASSFEINVAVVLEDDASKAVEDFSIEINNRQLPDEVKHQLTELAHTIQPIEIFKQFLEDEEMEDFIKVEYMTAIEAERALKEEEIVAFISIPEGFTYSFLQNLLLDEEISGELIVTSGHHSNMIVTIFEDTIDMFLRAFNFETTIQKIASGQIDLEFNNEINGNVITVTESDPVSSTTYYSIGMAVMFALYVASTMATKSHFENYQNVFSRILLSGKSPILYLSGKGITTTLLVVIQIFLLFLLSGLILQAFDIANPSFWIGASIVTLIFAISVGSIAMLLISITIRNRSDSIANVFSFGFITIMAMLGGSFAPLSQLPDIVSTIGEWTPNGIALSALLQWSQGLGLDFIAPMLGRLVLISILFIVISYFIFPKREAKS